MFRCTRVAGTIEDSAMLAQRYVRGFVRQTLDAVTGAAMVADAVGCEVVVSTSTKTQEPCWACSTTLLIESGVYVDQRTWEDFALPWRTSCGERGGRLPQRTTTDSPEYSADQHQMSSIFSSLVSSLLFHLLLPSCLVSSSFVFSSLLLCLLPLSLSVSVSL